MEDRVERLQPMRDRGRIAARLAGRVARLAVDLVLPPRCFACGGVVAEDAALCGACWDAMTFVAAPLCACCGACLARLPAWARARAALVYDAASRPLLRFKHGDELQAAPLFAAWMRQAGGELLASADLVAPVPLHRRRLLARRYNQSAVLAGALGRASGRPVENRLLWRRRATASQGRLSRAGRRRNVAGAFAVTPGLAGLARGRRVLLIDDVMTTGATAEACSRTLLRAGASAVDVLTVARVP